MPSKTTKLPDQAKDVTKKDLDHEEGLYRHVKRPEWGVAILAWEKENRRAYQFEDGRLRKFKKGYYSLMEPVDEVPGSKKAVVDGLEDAIEVSRGEDPPQALEPVAPFEAQVNLFLEKYPRGFNDEEWISDHRGRSSGRALKRHREPAMGETQELLSKENCERLIGQDRQGELMDAILGILGGTDLVALKHVKVLKKLDEGERREFAETIADLLHGEDPFSHRFKRYVEMMTKVYDGAPSWRIATALPALMYPHKHVCVRRSAFKRQAASIAPTARYSKRTKLRPYKNYQRVAYAVRKRLEAAGQEPRDLLDVHDFVWATLRNASLDDLKKKADELD